MKHYIYTFILLLSLTGFAQSTQNFDQQKNDDLLKDFEKTEALKHAHYGISIRQLSNGKEIVNVNAKHSFAPASNLKLLYTLTAVEQLGKDYRYKTTLTYSGKIVNKILFGDLIIQASGDPSFGSIRMDEDYQALINQMMSRLRNLGIQKISGQLVMEVNGWRYPAAGSWPIEDIGNYYGTGAWGFNFNDNRLDIYLKRGSHIGEPTNVIKTEPDVSSIKYISKVVTAGPETDDEAYVYAAPFDTERYILGTIPAGKSPFKIKGGMPNPPLSFLKLFKQNLADNQISVDGIQVRYAIKKHKEILWQYQSQPMIELAKYTNDYSINHFSEALAWSLIQGDKPANGYLAKKAIHEFFAPYGFESADIEDGCGLAPDNLVEPAQMTHFLSLMSKKLGQAVVLDILPHGGEDGYAKYFLKNDPVQKQVWVKSGSVSKVQNYTGIFKGQSGKYYAFSIMTNYFIGEHKDVQKAIQNLVKNYIEEL